MSKKNRKEKKTNKTTTVSGGEGGAEEKSPKCYHGSSEEEFNIRNSGEYLKAVEEYFHRAQTEATKQTRQQEPVNLSKNFAEDYHHLMIDSDFGTFIFAWCTREYFKSNELKNRALRNNITILLILGFMVRYHYAPLNVGKYVGFGSEYMENLSKYNRDIYTDRGIIKCLARETPCDCMKFSKKEAKSMDKLGFCFGCKQLFPKESLLLCSGCRDVKYHSRDCQLQYWHEHKVQCRLKQKIIKEQSETRELINGMTSMVE